MNDSRVRSTPARSTRILILTSGVIALAMAAGPRLWGSHGPLPAGPIAPAICGRGEAPPRDTASFPLGTLTAGLSGGRVLRGGPGETYLSVDLAAAAVAGPSARPPLDLAIVIDRSGSMSGEKIVAARRAAEGILSRLADGDRVALVEYDSTADVLVPLAPLGGGGRERLRSAIAAITPRGGTNLHGGMVLGHEQLAGSGAGRVNRVVLLSDGQANQGIVDPATLGRVAAEAADRGIRTTTVGIGLDYNEDLMELLAENGRGHYYYVKDAASLEEVFAGELRSMQSTVATAAALELEPACAGVEVLQVFGYAARREKGRTIVPLVDLFGGDSRRLVAKLRVPAGAEGRADLVRVRLSYVDARTGRRGRAELALGAEVSADPVAVEAAIDRTVLGHVVQIEGAAAMREATAVYERGDRDGARALLERKESDMRALAARYKVAPAQVDRALSGLGGLADDIAAAAPESASGKDVIKAKKAEARRQAQAAW